MNCTIDNIAYRQDSDSLNKKIDKLVELSHMNDVSMRYLQETFPTADEVNEELMNYVQIKDTPPVFDTNEIFLNN